jgi:hypothetical protein
LPSLYGFSSYPDSEGSYKCNIFVAHRAVQVGIPIPAVHGIIGSYPPLANEWGSCSFDVKKWVCVDVLDFPQAGYISADPAGGGVPGHVGIVDFDGKGISAGKDNVNRNFAACSQDTILRRYEGEEK